MKNMSFVQMLRQRGYLALYPFVRPRVGARKRNSEVRFKYEKLNLFQAIDPKFDGELWFYATSRARLYFTPAGISERLGYLSRRYQDGPVQLESGETVVDVGANIGEFSIVAAAKCSVLSFEPDPLVVPCLRRNAKGRTVRVFDCALSDREGEITFYLASNSADSSIIPPLSYSREIKVRAEPLDDVLKRSGSEAIDFLKVEAEGAEPEVLSGAQQTLKKTKKVAVDVSPERCGESPWHEVQKTLKDNGFRVWRNGSVAFGFRD